ncbi:MAG TPA: DEAD/DEAH box helicase, partial [Mariniphaga sp.]|nr:DEAD/DEAH box helicase [Mariniphaga sp.]
DLDYTFKPFEKVLVELIDKYSDERLMKRFSRAVNVSEFFLRLETARFHNQVSPFIEKCMGEVARILMLSPVRLMNKEVKYANLYDEDEIDVPPYFVRPEFHFSRKETETVYRLKIYLNEKELPLLNRKFIVVANNPCILVYQNQLLVFEKLDSKKLIPFFTKEYISVQRSIEDKYYSGFVRKSIRDYDVVAEGFQLIGGQEKKQAVLTLENNLQMEPSLVLRFKYGNEQFLPNATRIVAVHYQKNDNDILFKKIKRDKVWEKNVLDRLSELGLKERDGFLFPSDLNNIESGIRIYEIINWLNHNKPLLEGAGVVIEQGVLDKTYFTGEQHLDIKTDLSGDWFDVYATVTFGKFSFPFIKLKHHILNDIREFELPNGEVAVIPDEWLARYKSLMPFARSNADKLQFGKHHFALVADILKPGNVGLVEKIRKLTSFKGNIKLPEELDADLRNYQLEGVKWMYGLHRNGFGGCLADDMGLGKTLQTLTLLLLNKRADGEEYNLHQNKNDGQLNLFGATQTKQDIQPASLIVLPTSLVHNWKEEIKKFTPSLKVYRHVSQNRKSGADLENAVFFYDIILTTYGTVRNDVDELARLKFYYLILDESQYVKNPTSKTYKSVIKLQSMHRMALTGTPIENSLSDLWAQLNFLNKGLLGNLAFFKRYFITPIEKHNNVEQQEKLQVMIRPFILRRSKDEVAKDLPPLMEQVIVCEMENNQLRKYETEKSIIRNSILAGIEQDGVKSSALVILQGLTRLRQLANHPKMLTDIEDMESGKFDEIMRMLENVVAEKHKVLVFSSFVKHLELIRNRIEKEGWKYSLLTGETAERGTVIKQFQDDPENRIFLISIRAGGVGLNLTSADYVFIVDPWWNPAVENQAISRAHRIGQNKHVFVYRFITRGSIEEKIQQLQNRKSSLADKFINSNNPLKELSKEEVLNLLR